MSVGTFSQSVSRTTEPNTEIVGGFTLSRDLECLPLLKPLHRYIATPALAKHRIFAWLTNPTLPDHQLLVFARADDYFFGVLHSRIHEVWALRMGTSLEDRPRYTPTTTFETFPFPWPPGQEPADDPRVQAIAAAAADLVAKRDAWLNPTGASDAERKQRTLTNLYNARPAWLDLAHRGAGRGGARRVRLAQRPDR